MKIKEKKLHYIAAKFILGENVSIKINGEDAQLTVLHDLLNVSRSLKESLEKGTEMSSKIIQQIGARL